MTDSAEPLELIRLDDGAQSVVVRVLSTQPEYHDAEIVISSGFVNAAVLVDLNAEDIGDWGNLLDAVEDDDADTEQDEGDVFAAQWPSRGRAAYITFMAEDPYIVEVHDAQSTQICVSVPLDLKEGWIEGARARLVAVRQALGI